VSSEWKESFLAYENLQSRWPSEGLTLLKDLVSSVESPESWLQQYCFAPPDPSLLAEAKEIRPVFIDALSRIGFPRRHFTDVYHAAIYMASQAEYWSLPDYAYRGQRDHRWPMSPTLFRPAKGKKQLTPAELNSRLSKLAIYSEALEAEYPDRFSEYQRIAIGQHYGLKTWLLDLTSDPWVALFFASEGGEEGDVGMLTRFSMNEWDSLSASGDNCLGAMTLIEVSGVPRIDSQKALFLNSSHPDLIVQYGAEQLLFSQRQNLVFESECKGITKSKLLADDEAFATFTAGWLAGGTPPPSRPLGMQPLESAARSLRAADYRQILQTIIEKRHMTHRLSEEVNKSLCWFCDFHLELQRPTYAAQFGSIHLLIGAAERILVGQTFQEIMTDIYCNHIERDVLRQVLRTCDKGQLMLPGN
jgi:hypothetical protein